MKNIMCAMIAGVVLTSCMKNEEASTATSEEIALWLKKSQEEKS